MPEWPESDVLIVPERGARKICFAPQSWDPPLLRWHMNERREVFPVGQPDLEDLEDFMWSLDAPYVKHPRADGGVALYAKGRGGMMLAFWLKDLIVPGWKP